MAAALAAATAVVGLLAGGTATVSRAAPPARPPAAEPAGRPVAAPTLAVVEVGAPAGEPAGAPPVAAAPPAPGPAPGAVLPPPPPADGTPAGGGGGGLALEALDPAGFALSDGGSFERLAPWVAALEGRLERVSLGAVLGSATRRAQPLCLPVSAPAPGFCWDGEDAVSSRWQPAGVTGASGAWAAAEGAAGALAVAWVDRTGAAGVRVSLVRAEAGGPARYEHVLLVEPTGPDRFGPVVVAGGGLAWSGPQLFVADGGGLRVFDLRHLWRVEGSDPATVGRRRGGGFHAAGLRYALAQVGAYQPAGPGACGSSRPATGEPLCLGFVGLDPTSAPPALLGGEALDGLSGGRLARWELDGDRLAGSGGVAPAARAWRSGRPGLSGVAAHRGVLVGAGTEAGTGALWVESPPGEGSRLAFPAGARGLALVPETGLLWTATDGPGGRAVVAVRTRFEESGGRSPPAVSTGPRR